MAAGRPVTTDGPPSSGDAGAEAGRARVGAGLRAARRRARLTQTEVARDLGIAQTSVSALERGVYLPDEATWQRLVATYELPGPEADELRRLAREARPLRGAAASARSSTPWPVDPASASRRAWCGAVRRHHRLTRAELAERIGVPPGAVAKLEQDDAAMPTACKAPSALRRLADLGETTEAALRGAWQPADVVGLEHLIGMEPPELVAAAEDLIELLRWLLASGWTQVDVAGACGVSRPAVSQWLSHRTAPAPATLRGLAAALDVEPGSLERLRVGAQ
jgi:transcriptional regulator with XRE-family HTH domain